MAINVSVLGITGATVIYGSGTNLVLINTDDHRADVSLHFFDADVAKAVADAINKAVAK